jgi:methylmalonyl-CoA epimerase
MESVDGIGAELDHLGIAVRRAEEAVRFYAEVLGLPVLPQEVIEDQGVKVLSVVVGGSKLELLEPLGDDTPVGRFVAKRGEGIHHICLRVKDLRAVLRRLEEAGVELVDREPRRGAHNMLIAFVHPRSTGGVLVELSQPAE